MSSSKGPWSSISVEDFHHLAEKYGTPFFLYDADAVIDRIKLVRESMQGLAKVFYAVKANPNLELLRAIRDAADGLDISSGGELEQAQLAGFDPASLSFAGPAKSKDELTISIKKRVGSISIESPSELLEVAKISKSIDYKTNVILRVNQLT